MNFRFINSVLMSTFILVTFWSLNSSLAPAPKTDDVTSRTFMRITQTLHQTLESQKQENRKWLLNIKESVLQSNRDTNASQALLRAESVVEATEQLMREIEAIAQNLVEYKGHQGYVVEKDGTVSYLGSERSVLLDADNTRITTRVLIRNTRNHLPRGAHLQSLVRITKTTLVNSLNELPGITASQKSDLALSLPLIADDFKSSDGQEDEKWYYTTFHKNTLAGALAVLAQIQFDASLSEAIVLRRIQDAWLRANTPVKAYHAVVQQDKGLIARGEKLQARIFLSAQVGNIHPEIYVGGEPVDVENGVGLWETAGGKQGRYDEIVELKVQNPKTGQEKVYPATINYQVFNGDADIIASKNNALFLGLENPVEISVPGYEPGKISVSLSPLGVGTIVKRRPGRYHITLFKRVRGGCTLNVSVKTEDGHRISKGSRNFRTIEVPSPYAHINYHGSGDISKEELAVARRLGLSLDNFLYDGIRYTATFYRYRYTKTDGTAVKGNATGSVLPTELKKLFENAKAGDNIVIYAITGKAAGIREVQIPGSLVFDVK